MHVLEVTNLITLVQIIHQDVSLCGDVLESKSGQFGYIYPGKFDDVSVNCDWSIRVPGNKPAYLKVKRLHIETTQCAQSLLEVGSQ